MNFKTTPYSKAKQTLSTIYSKKSTQLEDSSSKMILQKNFCRICWEKEDQNQLQCFCGCRGSVKFCHTQCMKSWILSKINAQEEDLQSFPNFINCELCNQQINFEKNKSIRLLSCEECNERMKTKGLFKLVLIILFLIVLVGLMAGIGFLFLENQDEILTTKLTYLSLIILLGILFLSALGFIFYEYTIENELYIDKIQSTNENPQIDKENIKKSHKLIIEDLS